MKLSGKRIRAWTGLNSPVALASILLLVGCGIGPASETVVDAAPRIVESRALTIPWSFHHYSHLLKANDRVDVAVTVLRPGHSEPETLTILHYVEVLGVGGDERDVSAKTGSSAPSQESTVTLFVTPDEAELLVFAQEHGEFSLTQCDHY